MARIPTRSASIKTKVSSGRLGLSRATKDSRPFGRKTLDQLTKGSPVQRSLNNYAKQTPSGAGALGANTFLRMDKFKLD